MAYKDLLAKKLDEFESGQYAGKEVTEFIQWLVDTNARPMLDPGHAFIVEFFIAMGLVKESPQRNMQ